MFSPVFPIYQQQCFGIQGIKHVIMGQRTQNEKSCCSQKPTCLEVFPGNIKVGHKSKNAIKSVKVRVTVERIKEKS